MALLAGTRLGPYEILGPIGAGGMGEVYKANDTRLDRTVAIKVLREQLALSPERKQRFEREAKAISKLNHPHICILYDVGNEDGADYLVMEYIEGETLAERLKKGALPLDKALEYGIQIADGLDTAHRAGIVHRDLKPANLILNINQNSVAPEGFEPTADRAPSINRNVVSLDYFDMMGIRIVRGRGFVKSDDAEAPAVVMVNETLAARFWPGEDAVGKRMGRPGGTMMEVVGVVEDGKYLTLGEDPASFFFYPLKQRQNLDMTIVVRTQGDPRALLEHIRDEVRAMDAGLPLYGVKPMEEHLQIALAPAQAGASLLGSFAFLALGLAAVGLYGMLAFAVAQQSFEIGLRRALGAGGRDILVNVLREGMRLTLLGASIGLVLSVGLVRLTASLLYGIKPVDPMVFALAVLVLAGTALLASYVPARRATRVDPIVALRAE